MDAVTFSGTGLDQKIDIDAILVAKGLRIAPEALRIDLRGGSITRTVEKSEGEIASRYRGTFCPPTRRMRLLVTTSGEILQTSSVACSRKSHPPAP